MAFRDFKERFYRNFIAEKFTIKQCFFFLIPACHYIKDLIFNRKTWRKLLDTLSQLRMLFSSGKLKGFFYNRERKL